MKILKYAVLALSCFLFFSAGQVTYAAPKDTISVTGTAVTDVQPDMAYVHMSLESRGETASEARQLMADKIDTLKRVLLGQQITTDNIKTSGYNLGPRYEYERNKRVQKGFISNVDIIVKVKELDKLSAVVDRSITKSTATVNSVDFGLQDKNVIEQSLLDDAVNNGRAKAAVVANAGGRTLGNLQSADINNAGGEARVQMPQATLAMMKANADAAAPTPTEFSAGTITVRTTVSMVFALL
jgi:uncharacterized protein YggE